MIDESLIRREFARIKALGYLQSRRANATGIGKTFEDYLGVDENNRRSADFAGFEVKSHRELSAAKITLFTKAPSYPRGANRRLTHEYGSPDVTFPELKVLHTSMYANRFNTYCDRIAFKLQVNRQERKVGLLVKGIRSDEIIDNTVYWTFEHLNERIEQKLQALFFVTANTVRFEHREMFHFTSAQVFYGITFGRFLELLEAGNIQFDIRVGAYKTPGSRSFGKYHDHGSAFRVDAESLSLLFPRSFEIE